MRWLKHPWSVLAYQIAGDDGLRLLQAEGLATERESAAAGHDLKFHLRIELDRQTPGEVSGELMFERKN